MCIIWQKIGGTPRTTFYSKIKPDWSLTATVRRLPRHVEVRVNRLLLGTCLLNRHLFHMRKHSTGLSDQCQVPETLDHFLLKCNNPAADFIRSHFGDDVTVTLSMVFSDESLLLAVEKLIDRKL